MIRSVRAPITTDTPADRLDVIVDSAGTLSGGGVYRMGFAKLLGDCGSGGAAPAAG